MADRSNRGAAPSYTRQILVLGIVSLAMALELSPAVAQAPAGNARVDGAATIVRGYPVPAEELAAMTAELEARFRARTEVRIVADPRTRQLVVIAPADVHGEIATRLAAPAPAPIPNLNPPPANAVAAAAPKAALATIEHQLRNRSWPEFEGRLQRFWGGQPIVSRDKATYRNPAGRDGEVALHVDRQQQKISIEAPATGLAAWQRLVQAIDAPRGADGEQSELVSLDRADPEVIGRAVSLLRAARQSTDVKPGKRHIGQFVTMIFQPGDEVAQGAQPDAQPVFQPAAQPAQPNQPAAAAPAGDDDALGRIGNVEIQFIEGLDIIIIKGKQRDVERVQRIIEEIELQSAQTRPEIELYYLKHVDGRALNDILIQVYDQVFAARQGRVTITPLVKPNALMLIGRAENIGPVKELIEKLDRPVAADSELKVFRLKFMSSVDAERTIRNFFVDIVGQGVTPRTGLGTRVGVVADYRTNSLIVQASPRDLVEVATLLQSLDTETVTGGAVNEVRIFKLRNALADDLAPILQEAVTGQQQGGLGGQGQQGVQQQQQQQGAQGGLTQARSTQRATSLQLLKIDQQGAQILQSGILADMRITSDPRGNALVVSGPPQSMSLIAELIRQLDELPASEAQIKVFTIVNGDATSLAEMLQTLFGQQTQGQGQGGGGQPQFGLQGSTGDSSLVPLRFSVDQRTNSIIATGGTSDLDVVYKILVRLDEGDIRQRVTTVYPLRNAPALDVANSLNTLLTSQRQINQLSPNLTSPFEQIEREVIVVAEGITNSLIVSATPRYFEEIKRIVESLDRRPPMVMIQVMIAEVQLGDVEQFGVELGLQDSLLFDRGIGAIGFPFNQAGIGNNSDATSLATRENVAGQSLSNLGVGRTNSDLGFGGLVLSASNESVSLLVRALQQNNRLQVIARPQVQTLDNQGAFVQVGARVPFITSSQLTVNGTTNNVEFQDVGIILGVTPRTSPDGVIVMEINATNSELGPIAEGIPISINANGDVIRSPQIRTTTAQTTIAARNGQTVILGGLISKSQTEVTRRVPYLGDVPVLGRLFRFDSVTTNRRELLIIMTPHIMKTNEDIDWMNTRESERMSWCLADVANIHGEVSLGGGDGRCFNLQSPVIFPDADPTGTGVMTTDPSATNPSATDLQYSDPGAGPQMPLYAPPETFQPAPAAPQIAPPGPQQLQKIIPVEPIPETEVRVTYGPPPEPRFAPPPAYGPAGPAFGPVAPAAYVQPSAPAPNFPPLR